MPHAARLGGLGAGTAQPEGDIVANRQPGETRIFLEYHADAVRDFAHDRSAFETDTASGWRAQPSQHVQQRGLAAAGRADNREKLAARQIEVERS